MSKQLHIGDKKYLSSVTAGKAVGYSHDHLSRLCRAKTIECRRIGRSWYVEEESLNNFVIQQQHKRAQKKQELSEKCKREYHEDTLSSQEQGIYSSSSSTSEGAIDLHPNSTPITPTYFRSRLTPAPRTPLTPAPVHTVTQKLVALTTAVAIVFSTYTLSSTTHGTHIAHQVQQLPHTLSTLDTTFTRTLTTLDTLATNPTPLLAQVSATKLAHSLYTHTRDFFTTLTQPLTPTTTLLTDGSARGQVTLTVQPITTPQPEQQPTPPPTITQHTTLTQPVIERIIETTTKESGITLTQLQQTENELRKAIVRISTANDERPVHNFNAIAHTQRIDNLGDVDISNSRITNSSIEATTLTVASTATFNDAVTFNGTTTFATSPTITDLILSGDLAVNGGDITTTATTWNFDVADTGTISFRDGTNTLFTITDQGTTGNVTISGDLTVEGDDITLGTNTAGYLLVADGTNFNPTAMSGDISIDGSGVTTIQGDAVGSGEIVDGAVGADDIAATAVTAGSYGSASEVATFTVDADGRLTAAGTATISTDADTLDGLDSLQFLRSDTSDNFTSGTLTFDSSTTLNVASGGTLDVDGTVGSDLIPDANATRDLGTPAYYWDDVYVDNLVANNISAASSTIAGTKSETFTINTDNATADTEDADLVFFRGTVVPNALVSWDSTSDRFDLNQSTFIQNDNSDNTAPTLHLKGRASQTGDLLTLEDSAATEVFSVTPAGLTEAAGGFRVNSETVTDWSGTGITITGGALTATLGTSIDISDETNLAVGNGITLTDDTLTTTAAGGLAQTTGGLTTTGILEDLNTLGAAASDGQFLVATGAGAFAYESGSTARTSLGLGNVENTALSTWAGTANITTLGTISTGVWNGTAIDISSYTNLAAGTNISLSGDTLNVDDAFVLNTGDTITGALILDDTTLQIQEGADTLTLSVPALTAARAVTFPDAAGEISLLGQSIDLASEVTGTLPVANGGTGATTLNNLITLGTHTTGNYLATLADAGSGDITVSSSGSESAAVTLDITDDSLDFTELSDALTVDATTTFDLDTNSADLNFDSNTLVIDSSTDRVGIGTGSPDTLLNISSTSAPTLTIQDSDVNATGEYWYLQNSGTGLRIGQTTSADGTYTAWADRMSINTSGNVGIGTTSPSKHLHVSGATNPAIRTTDTTNTVNTELRSEDTLGFMGTASNHDLRLMTNGSSRLTIDTSGNVGIGTTAPDVSLHVSDGGTAPSFAAATMAVFQNNAGTGDFASASIIGGNATGASMLLLGDSDDEDIGKIHYDHGNNSLDFYTNTAEQMTINSSGNVGIGTASPDANLHVVNESGQIAYFDQYGASANTRWRRANGTIGSPTAILDDDVIGNFGFGGYDGSAFSSSAGAVKVLAAENWSASGWGVDLEFYTTPIGGTAQAARVTINASGNVGIGTTSPSDLLEVSGPAGAAGVIGVVTEELTVVDGDILGQIDFQAPLESSGTDAILVGASIWAEADATFDATTNATELVFATGASETATEKMRITSGGNIGIGTTSPGSLLDITGTAATPLFLQRTGASANTNIRFENDAGSVYAGAYGNEFGIGPNGDLNNSPWMRIDSSGNVGIGTTNPGSALDIDTSNAVLRLKSTNAGSYSHVQLDGVGSTKTASLHYGGNSDNTVRFGRYGDDFGAWEANVVIFDIDAPANALVLSGTGAVGVGTNTPGAQLEVGLEDGTTDGYLILNPVDSANEGGQLTFGGADNGAGTDFTNMNIDNYQGHLRFFGTDHDAQTSYAEYMRITSSGNVGIGDTSPDYTLELSGATAPEFALSDTDLTHGITNYAQTDSYFHIEQVTDNDGGARLWGFSDTAAQNPLRLIGAFGSTDPTDTVPAVWLIGGKRTGTSVAALGSDETVLQVTNNSADLMTVLGSGNVGVGTTSPSEKLHVYDDVSSGDAAIRITNTYNNGTKSLEFGGNTSDADTDAAITTISESDGGGAHLAFKVENSSSALTEYLRIDQSGNIGIGETNPTADVHVKGKAGVDVLQLIHTDSGGEDARLFLGESSLYGMTVEYDGAANMAYLGINNNVAAGSDAYSKRMQMSLGGSEVAFMAGNVGIGTTSPGTKLDVTGGDVHIQDTTPNIYLYSEGATNNIQFNANITDAVQGGFGIYENSNALIAGRTNYLQFFSQNTERVRIDPSGNVGIGTTDNLDSKLTVGGFDNNHISLLSSNKDYGWVIDTEDQGSGDVPFRIFKRTNDVNTEVLTIKNQDGYVGIGTTTPAYKLHVEGDVAASAFVNTSTGALKTNITYLEDTTEEDILEKINDLDVAQYHYTFEDDTNPLRLGLIAEEAPTEVLSVDGDGIDLYKLVTFTLAGVKAQQRQIDELDIRLADIEAALALQEAAEGEGGIVNTILAWLGNIGISVSESLAKFNNLAAAAFTVGSEETPSGITLYDKETNEPYCLEIAGGEMVHTAGTCEALAEQAEELASPTLQLIGTTPAHLPLHATYSDLGAVAKNPDGADITYHTYLNGIPTTSIDLNTATTSVHYIDYITIYNEQVATTTRTIIINDAELPQQRPEDKQIDWDTAIAELLGDSSESAEDDTPTDETEETATEAEEEGTEEESTEETTETPLTEETTNDNSSEETTEPETTEDTETQEEDTESTTETTGTNEEESGEENTAQESDETEGEETEGE